MRVRSAERGPELTEDDLARLVNDGGQSKNRRRGWKFWVPVSLGTVALLTAFGVGGFFFGQSTRYSTEDVEARVASQARFDRKLYTRQREAALESQRETMATRFDNTLEDATDEARQSGYSAGQDAGYSAGESAGYAAGESAGYTSGQADGYEDGSIDGYADGSDEGTCYTPGTYYYVC